jgi:polar amino acid transport system substrate-binding protein
MKMNNSNLKAIIQKVTVLPIRHAFYLLGTMTACVLMMPSITSAEVLKLEVLTMEMPPYVMPGAESGIVIDTLKEVAKRSGMELKFSITPLKRGSNEVKQTPNTCVAPLDRSQERETEYKWVSPVLITQSAFFSKKKDSIKIDTLTDAKKHKVGVLRGGVVEEMLTGKKFELENANDDFQNLKKLQAGRFELWAADTLIAPYWAKQEKIDIEELYTFATTLAAMACNKGISDQKIEKMNAELTKMYKDGKMKQIFQKYTSQLGIHVKASFLN